MLPIQDVRLVLTQFIQGTVTAACLTASGWTRSPLVAGVLLLVCAVAGSAQIPSFFGPSGISAKPVKLDGQISILKDSQTWALELGATVQPKQVIVTGPNGYGLFQVSDGSTFEVFSNSMLTFRANSGSLRDLLDVWLGRVKVHIEKVGGRPNPNNVRTPTAVISVRGTTFDITVDENDDTTLVVVEEGQVAVQHALMPRGDAKLVNPGEYLRVYRDQPLAERSMIDKGGLIMRAARALSDALNTMVYSAGHAGTGTTKVPGVGTAGTGGGVSGDTGAAPPPPPPPPPPPTGTPH